MARRFEGKTALVTGGSRGIGKAIVECLIQEGAKVYVIGKSHENINKLKAENPSIVTIQVDVTDWNKTKSVVENIGVVDLLVNNAGIHNKEDFVDVKQERLDISINTNFKSAFNITQAVARGLILAGRPGSIVNISSTAGLKCSIPGFMSYCVSKTMMDMLTKVAGLELGPHKIRVNSINPTMLYTDMTKPYFKNQEFMKEFLLQHSLRKFATLQDVVNATMFLLSEDSAMITGSTLAVDGGLLL